MQNSLLVVAARSMVLLAPLQVATVSTAQSTKSGDANKAGGREDAFFT